MYVAAPFILHYLHACMVFKRCGYWLLVSLAVQVGRFAVVSSHPTLGKSGTIHLLAVKVKFLSFLCSRFFPVPAKHYRSVSGSWMRL
jgi:hypothetical protein